MTEIWDEARLQGYITDEIEESLNLDYKESRSIGKNNDKTDEITKDVSAMANSDGGIIIYGIAEYQEKEKRHKPEKLDPIDRTQYSKEWLQQTINKIRPQIEGLRIFPVKIGSDDTKVVYVVEIPKSRTAHQATNYRYYYRYEFESKPMEHYQLLDVMGRGQYPQITLQFVIKRKMRRSLLFKGLDPQNEVVDDMWVLSIDAVNIGNIFAQYVYCKIYLPAIFQTEEERESIKYKFEHDAAGKAFYRVDFNNGEFTDVETEFMVSQTFRPILPSLSLLIGEHEISTQYLNFNPFEQSIIKWEVFADNAPVQTGKILIKDIPFEEK